MKHVKRAACLLLACVMTLTLGACSSSKKVEPMDFAEKFNKVSQTYQINLEKFKSIKSADGSEKYSYNFTSEDQNVGVFALTIYIDKGGKYIQDIGIVLPLSLSLSVSGSSQEGENKKTIPAERKQAFKDISVAVMQAYTGVSKKRAENNFNGLGFDQDEIYTNYGVTSDTLGNFEYRFRVGQLNITSLHIINNALTAADSNDANAAEETGTQE